MAIKFNRSQTFATNGTVTAAGLHNLIDGTDIYQALITDQTNLTSVGSGDELLIADADLTANDAPRAVTVNELFEDALTISTYTNANINNISYGTSTGTRLIANNASITTGTIPNLTSSTANITNGTIQTLTSSTATITGGINSTSGTIPTLVATTLITTGTGTAATPAIVPTGDTNTGIFFPAADTIAFTDGGSEAMRIDSIGQIGVGTASPSGRLEVSSVEISGQTGAQCVFPRAVTVGFAGGSYGAIGYNLDYRNGTNNNTGVKYLITDTISQLDFENGGFIFRNAPSGAAGATATITERLRIEATGTLTSQPTYDNTAAGSAVIVTSAGLIRRTSSSLRYKKDIENLDSSIVDNAIDKLRPVWYRTKNPEGDDKSTWSHVGLIAEEVDSVEPRLVRYKTVEVSINENGERIETQLENPVPEDVDYARLSVVLLSEVKAQRVKIASLEARLEALEAK
jgi:hypothetical protein